MNAINNTKLATEILCRFDPAKNKPIVFIATEMAGNDIKSWITGEPEMTPLSYYHTTLPLSAADEEVLAKRFSRHFGEKHVVIRHRLPRTAREVPNRIARTATPAVETPVAAPAPVVAQSPIRRKTAAKKGGTRKPAAKPVDSAPVANDRASTMRRATDQNPAPSPSLEAKVDQLAQIVAQLAEKLAPEVVAK